MTSFMLNSKKKKLGEDDDGVALQDGTRSPSVEFQAFLNEEKVEIKEKEAEENQGGGAESGGEDGGNNDTPIPKRNPCSNCLTKCSRTLRYFINCRCRISPQQEEEQADKRCDHTSLALQLTLGTNVLIVVTMSVVAIATDSLALLSSLIENMVDLFVQALLWYAGSRMRKKPDYAKFPVGTSRFEPVAVIVASSIMALVSVMIIQESIKRLIAGFAHDDQRTPQLSPIAIAFGGVSILLKLLLYVYCQYVYTKTKSSAVDAIRQDNRNDAVSNSFAITAYILASSEPRLWFIDALGAMIVFGLILISWAKTAKTQMMQLVGVCASEEFIQQVKELCAQHHPLMQLDILRAYHFGTKYLVELEVVFPAEMTVKQAHDIGLQLQFKVEQLEEVERAFVHVDYQERAYDEHRVSHDENALVLYCGGDLTTGTTPTCSPTSSSSSMYPTETPLNTCTTSATKETEEEVEDEEEMGEENHMIEWSLPAPIQVKIHTIEDEK